MRKFSEAASKALHLGRGDLNPRVSTAVGWVENGWRAAPWRRIWECGLLRD